MSTRTVCTSDKEALWVDADQLQGLATSKEDGNTSELGINVRISLFFMSPVTIFVIDAVIQIGHILVFMFFLLRADHTRTELTTTEWVLAAMQASTTLTEVVQLLVDGASTYFESKWNCLKVIGLVFFWMGFRDIAARAVYRLPAGHHACTHTGLLAPLLNANLGACTPLQGHPLVRASEVRDVGMAGDSDYAVSLCFMLLRVLHVISVHKDLGPLVVVLGRMARDMCVFTVIWAILLLAFSVAIHGTELLDNAADPACLAQGDVSARADGFVLMRCWNSWWVLRTYYQALGQPFFEDLKTDGANLVAIVMFPVMNLMLANLLIAMMNDTYAEVKENSKLEWMVAMLHLAKEYRSPSRLNAVMLLYDIASFIVRRDEINSRLSKLVGGHVPTTWLEWIEDVRFKFKKFQCRDIPSVPVTEQQQLVDTLLHHLEQEERQEAERRRNVLVSGAAGSSDSLTKSQDLSDILKASNQDLTNRNRKRAHVSMSLIARMKLQMRRVQRAAADVLEDQAELRQETKEVIFALRRTGTEHILKQDLRDEMRKSSDTQGRSWFQRITGAITRRSGGARAVNGDTGGTNVQFQSLSTSRKTALKLRRSKLVKQRKIDVEETRRCTDFLLRAMAVFLRTSDRFIRF